MNDKPNNTAMSQASGEVLASRSDIFPGPMRDHRDDPITGTNDPSRETLLSEATAIASIEDLDAWFNDYRDQDPGNPELIEWIFRNRRWEMGG